MASCIVDIEFLYNEDDVVFPKRVLICGITAHKKPYMKEIIYKLPILPHRKSANSLEEKTRELEYGRLNFSSTDQDVYDCLTNFDVIITKNNLQKGFITSKFPMNDTKVYKMGE